MSVEVILPGIVHMPDPMGQLMPHRISDSSIVHVMTIPGAPQMVTIALQQRGEEIGFARVMLAEEVDELIGALKLAKTNAERLNAGLDPIDALPH